MPRLVIDSTKPLYAPIEIEIDGQVLTLERVTQSMLQEIDSLERELQKGRLENAWRRLEVLFGPNEVFSKLDIFQVERIIAFVVRAILAPEAAEKNEPGPDEGKSQG